MTEISSPDTLALALRIADLVRERRGTDLVLLDVRTLVDYTDFFLLASGQSGRQNQAIGEHVVRTLKADHRYAISKSGLDTGSWICLDMGDVVVHVFEPETRARYDLELLWADAPRIDLVRRPAEGPAPRGAADAAGAPAPDEEMAPPKRRRRVVRRAAVEDADAANAPDSERPPQGEPEPERAEEADVAPRPPPSSDRRKAVARKAGAADKASAPKKPAPKAAKKGPGKRPAKRGRAPSGGAAARGRPRSR